MTRSSITFVEVPAGSAVIADQRTGTSWNVDVRSFLLAATPITRRQYRSITSTALAGRGYSGQSDSGQDDSVRDPGRDGSLLPVTEVSELDDSLLPVTEVSWRDAVTFCNRLSASEGLPPAYALHDGNVRWDHESAGYRLPTEAEWVHACRAGTSGARYSELGEIAWYRDNSGGSAQPVARKAPNAWGLYDMLGNVFEWCWDLYDPEVYGTYRILKGGGWADPSWSCRAGVRRRSMETFAIDDVGFRVARSSR